MGNLIDQSMKVEVSKDDVKDGKYSVSFAGVRNGATEAQMVSAAKVLNDLTDSNGVVEVTLTQKYTLDTDADTQAA